MIMNERVVIRPSSHLLSFVASFFSRTARRSDNAVPCLRIICLALPLANAWAAGIHRLPHWLSMHWADRSPLRPGVDSACQQDKDQTAGEYV